MSSELSSELSSETAAPSSSPSPSPESVSENVWRDRLLSLFLSPLAESDRVEALPARVSLQEMRLLFLDESGARLGAPLNGDILLTRAMDDLALEAVFQNPVVSDDLSSSVSLSAAYRLGGETTKTLKFNFSGFRPDVWHDLAASLWTAYSGNAGALNFASDVALPLAGAVDLELEAGAARQVSLSLSGSPGEVRLGALYNEPLPVLAFGMSLNLARENKTWQGQLAVTDLFIGGADDTGELPVIGLNAELSARPGTSLSFAGTLSGEDMSVEWLTRLWPRAYLSPPRTWIEERVSRGTLSDIKSEMALSWFARSPSTGSSYATLDNLEVDFSFADMDVLYLDDFPAATNARGRARWRQSGMEFLIDEATSADLALAGSVRLEPNNGNWRETWLAIETETKSTLAAGLAFLDIDALGFLSRYGFNSAGVTGTADGALQVRLPIRGDVVADDVELSGDFVLRDYRWPGIVSGMDLSGGEARVSYGGGSLRAEGDALLGADTEVRFLWNRELRADGATHLEAETPALRVSDLRRFGLPPSDRIAGSIGGAIDLVSRGDTVEAALDLDLRDVSLSLPEIAWSKPRGAMASARLRTESRGGVMRSLRVESFGGISVLEEEEAGSARKFLIDGGEMAFTAAGELSSANFAAIDLGRTKVVGLSLARDNDGVYGVRAERVEELRIGRGDSGARLSLASGGNGDDSETAETETETAPASEEPETATATAPEEATEKTAFRVSFTEIGRLYFGEDAWLEGVTLDIHRDRDGGFRRIYLEGSFAESELDEGGGFGGEGIPSYGTVRLSYGEDEGGAWVAYVGVNPLGAGLRAFGLTGGVSGGYLVGEGASEAAWPLSPLLLRFEGGDFVLSEVNFFVQLLSLVSVTGAIESLVGQGVSFGNLTAEFSLDSDEIVVRDFFMSGERLGVSASGRTGLRGEGTEIQGAVVPAYIFNALLARIPLIGTLLSGGEEREGLFAVNYEARGRLSDPEVSVNPLSVISPGFVRRLFGGGARPPEDVEEEPIQLPAPPE